MKKIIFTCILLFALAWCSQKKLVSQDTYSWNQNTWTNSQISWSLNNQSLTWSKNVDEVIKIMNELLQK